ncbi:bifunctional [glutamate--ammonia ligase]-adenylyl-L-tyrosine phosphorylase/[glutamate--ammonia-ligase] adenylyltransferase [Mariprofundus erugo]|uniref:bifunctional [glutamate--ammonia ligase]-adenylyl-L-tyrosine phosphorylase/[glutamate--ammonia-ligase] adenylyltransferase n=1 Tax=Mariprofundus erugo TaxID=2528639 RepID=UPI0010FF169E|nr:bifunctional [glutamate--ammonia ligase]-adenylyl-L-tyrosine phosphorylase/[glutamate--ammonia-ligase] adenylyltransferase [Mariprofundus erugo]TLS76542.1 bifunctional [glutamate--ammonia ligase]-adenylyl-L-tyrosine phosphorylase/[glutamate--ammonia-ligase] adenylyltransferase [Mariprofundus erugo]
MSEPIDQLLTDVPQFLHADVHRVYAHSPLFAMLMRTATPAECKRLFVAADAIALPDASASWIPDCDSSDLVTCMRHLRQCKHRGHRHLIWWELGLHGDMDRSCQAIADFASGLLDQALKMAMRLIAPRYGVIEAGRFCIIGLGKLGGRELNLGSDVDPLFIWQGEGHSSGGRQSLPVDEYYMHLSRMLIRLMSERTADGIVWPVDMRLRPGGDGSAIALHLETTLSHYLEYGQTWERAMLIKSRPVAGDLLLGQAFIEGITPFIYRRYLDYTTVVALADMKRRIDGQAGSGGIAAGFDVKRGRGGIREIEFIIQSLQLLHGGRNVALRVQPSMQAIDLLQQSGIINAEDVAELKQAYRFWRRMEHAIQARRGEQTHRLPDDYRPYLSAATGIEDIERQMIHHAAIVEGAFSRFVKPADSGQPEANSWLTGHADALSSVVEADRERIVMSLQRIDESLARGMLPERSRGEVERILIRAMPRWLDDENGVTALEAFARLIHSISGRATWIDLLATHQGALDWLIGVLSASQYLADHIVRDPSWLEWPLMVERSETDIHHMVAELDGLRDYDHVEQMLADIGYWVDRARLLSALAVDAHTADAMTIGGWLADIADAATAATLRLCLHQMDLPADFPFVALAMGKHGSREMGLVSDLDMVFVLADENPSGMVGRRSMGEHAQRIGRRMIQYLTGTPPYGAGYEFDARLRPSGQSGVLVTNISGFRDYQLTDAQTWEHQALCRARPVAGPAAAREMVAKQVASILDLPRNHSALAAEVMEMREKMLAHLASKESDIINLKQDAGGLVDIEFLAQYARLAFGGYQRRTVDLLRSLPDSAPDAWHLQAEWLAESYLIYRQMENALRVELWRSIGHLPNDPAATEWETMRRHAAIHSPLQLKERMQRVHDCFHQFMAAELDRCG